jgi:hypothetical protein
MKKIIVALFLVALMSSPAFALFDNGGFELGTGGWTFTFGNVISDTYNPVWGVDPYSYGHVAPSIVTSSTYPGGYVTKNIDPYNGSQMLQINDDVGN